MTMTFNIPNMPQIQEFLGARYSVVLTKRFKSTYGNRNLSQKVEFRRLPDKRNIEAIVKDHDGGLTKLHLNVTDRMASFPLPFGPDDEVSMRAAFDYTWRVISDLLS